MTPDQMRARSSDKVKQILEMMKILNLRVEGKQRINEQGFLEMSVFWIDDEKYPSPEPEPVDPLAPPADLPPTGADTL